MMTTVHKSDKGYISITKGAPDVLINKCNKIYKNGKVETLTDEEKRVIYYYGFVLKLPYKQIAEHLHRHINTVKRYMSKIKRKYNGK